MTGTIVALHSHRTKAQPPAPAVTPLGEKIDQLADLRKILRLAQAAEHEMTAEITQALQATGLEEARGSQAIARLEKRRNLVVDAELLHEAIGRQAWSCMSVSTTRARQFLGQQDLETISEPIPSIALTVRPLAVEPAAA